MIAGRWSEDHRTDCHNFDVVEAQPCDLVASLVLDSGLVDALNFGGVVFERESSCPLSHNSFFLSVSH
jgi:hypothetical protein